MSKEQREERIAQLRLALQKKDTEELLEIWEKNDRVLWTPEAFEAIRGILLERMGSLPAQDEKTGDHPRLVADTGQHMDLVNEAPQPMTKRSLVSLFLKMVAIYFLVRSFPSLLSVGDSLYRLRDLGFPESFWIVLLAISSLLVFGILMVIVIWKSDRLSIRFVTKDGSLFPIGKLSSEEVQNLAFSWIGILILVSGVSGAVYNLAYLVRIQFIVGAEQVKIPYIQNSSQFISSLSEIIIGVVLFLYPHGLVRLWHSIQRQRFNRQRPNEKET